jgi:hypothetical protein
LGISLSGPLVLGVAPVFFILYLDCLAWFASPDDSAKKRPFSLLKPEGDSSMLGSTLVSALSLISTLTLPSEG